MKDANFELTATAVITGRVYDFDNMPLAGADVVLQRYAYDANGQKNMQMVQQARTHDLGEYRMFWVNPGVELKVIMIPEEPVSKLRQGLSIQGVKVGKVLRPPRGSFVRNE